VSDRRPAIRILCPDDAALAPSARLADARADVVAALPGAASHEAARREILGFLDHHPDALHRSCPEGHLTGSAAVADPTSKRLLLLMHAKVRRWLQPGGHADGDAKLAAVALREAEEETGLRGLRVVAPAVDLDVHVFRSASGAEPDHLHLDVRHLVIAPGPATPRRNHESLDHRWASVDELAALGCDAGTVRMARAALALLAHVEDG
jgi:8-oxo-dGTP pyrophosphatase MutT (NUDIX family)